MDLESIVEREEHQLLEPSLGERFMLVTQYINLYYTPILCIFGGFGNCVSLYIFCSTSAKKLSSSYYLSALAISDTGFLINLMALWCTTDLGFNVITTKLSCPLVMFLGQVTCFLSVWFVVAFTVERFFAVCYPLTRPTVCTVARARKVILGITLIALVAFSYVWVIAQVVEIGDEFYENGEKAEKENVTAARWRNGESIHELTDWTLSSSSPSIFKTLDNYFEDEPESTATATGSEEQEEEAWNKSSAFDLRLQHQKLFDQNLQPQDSLLNFMEFINSTQNSTRKQQEDFPVHLICTVPPKYYKLSRIANYLDSFFTLILPFCIITFLNIRITICVWKLKGQRETIVAVVKLKNSPHNATATAAANNAAVPPLLVSPSSPVSPTAAAPLTKPRNFSCSFLKTKNTVKFNNIGANGSRNDSDTPSPNEGTILTDPLVQDRTPSPQNMLSYSDPAGLNRHNNSTNQESKRSHASPSRKPPTSNRMTTKGINGHGHVNHQQHNSTAAEVRVTKTLLLVSTVFLVLNLPSHGMRAAAFIQQAFWPDSTPAEPFALHQWSYMLFNTNFGVNFLLYCVSGRNFRKALYNLLCCTNRRNRRKRGVLGGGSVGAGGGGIGIGRAMMLRQQQHQSIRRKSTNSSYRPSNNNNKRGSSNNMKRRVLKSCTHCPSLVLRNTTSNEIHLQNELRDSSSCQRQRQQLQRPSSDQDEQRHCGGGRERHPSIQRLSSYWRKYENHYEYEHRDMVGQFDSRC